VTDEYTKRPRAPAVARTPAPHERWLELDSVAATVARDHADADSPRYLVEELIVTREHGAREAVARRVRRAPCLVDRVERLDRGFEHPAAERVLQWDVRHARAEVDGLLRHVRVERGRHAPGDRAQCGPCRARDTRRAQRRPGQVADEPHIERRDRPLERDDPEPVERG
jgi:hypothetical protein